MNRWVPKESKCEHKDLEMLHKNHTLGVNGKLYKIWRAGYFGYYKCKDCGETHELDSWGFRYSYE